MTCSRPEIAEATIRLLNVSKVFNQGRPGEHVALRGVNLSIDGGKLTVLRGPSGSGKTTLLGLIGCMSRPTSGRIYFMGDEISSLPERFLTEIRRKRCGFIFQQMNLIRGITALENVMVPAYPTGEKRSSIRERAMSLLETLNLSAKARSRAEWLSGGEAQRAAIARALINEPDIVIADEPTAHLDGTLSGELMETLSGLRDRGKTVIVASHDPLVFESPSVDDVVDVRHGNIAARSGR